MNVKRRWSIILPVFGLLLFSAITFASIQRDRHFPSKTHFYWGTVGLERLPQRLQPPPCQEPCVGWDEASIIRHPGIFQTVLVLTSLPAFLVAVLPAQLLVSLGLSQVSAFFITVPPLVIVWYYLLGWLLDRRRWRKQLKQQGA
jgi:hypothetical protein